MRLVKSTVRRVDSLAVPAMSAFPGAAAARAARTRASDSASERDTHSPVEPRTK